MKKTILLTFISILSSCSSNLNSVIINPNDFNSEKHKKENGIIIIGTKTNEYDFLLKNNQEIIDIIDGKIQLKGRQIGRSYTVSNEINYIILDLKEGNYTISELKKTKKYKPSLEERLKYESNYKLSFNIKANDISYIGTIKTSEGAQSKYIKDKYQKSFSASTGKVKKIKKMDAKDNLSLEFLDTYNDLISKKLINKKIDKKLAYSTFLTPAESNLKIKKEFEAKFEKECLEKKFLTINYKYNNSYKESKIRECKKFNLYK